MSNVDGSSAWLSPTNFRRASVSVEKHTAAVGHATRAAEEAVSHGLAGLHGLESEISSHRFRDVVAVITVLDALLGNVLYLCAPTLSLACRFGVQSAIFPHLFWNQIWTDRSVMLISAAILSRVAAVGVGFLLNSTSSVTS
jgi:hypothetical protein